MSIHRLVTLQEAGELISGGNACLVAGDESLLARLPRGNWIGGTIPYFMTGDGGCSTDEKLFITRIGSWAEKISIKVYDEKEISSLYRDIPENGLTFVIMPAFSSIHSIFATNAPAFPEFGNRPLAGWIAGVHVDSIGVKTPKCFSGADQKILDNAAVALHCTLHPGKQAIISILNIFSQGEGDGIQFLENGFSASTVLVNGREENLSRYLQVHDIDTRLPLVADYAGAMINTSFQENDTEMGIVRFYAPVFSDILYRQAAPVKDYIDDFTSQMPPASEDTIAFSCNCILNYLYSGLEGRSTGPFIGPVTFGEIAYLLLNQTMVYASIVNRA